MKLLNEIAAGYDSVYTPRKKIKLMEHLDSICEFSAQEINNESVMLYQSLGDVKLNQIKENIRKNELARRDLAEKKPVKKSAGFFDNQKRLAELEDRVKQLELMQKIEVKKHARLQHLFALDLNTNEDRPIKNFYYEVIHKLTAFYLAITVLSSGKVERKDSWKDQLVSMIFGGADNIVQAAGGATSFFMGSGVIIPIILSPAVKGTELLFEQYRDNKKMQEFNQGANFFYGSISEVEEKINEIAYSLTYLLQMQLKECTITGIRKLVKYWHYNFAYELLKSKDEHNKDVMDLLDKNNLIKKLEKIFNEKSLKEDHLLQDTTIDTKHNLKWSAKEIFTEAGICFYEKKNDEKKIVYQSLVSHKNKDNTTIIKHITNASKYGYHSYKNESNSIGQCQARLSVQVKNSTGKSAKKKLNKVAWVTDAYPMGPNKSILKFGKPFIPKLELSEKPKKRKRSLFKNSFESVRLDNMEKQLEDIQKKEKELEEKDQRQAQKIEKLQQTIVDMQKKHPKEKID